MGTIHQPTGSDEGEQIVLIEKLRELRSEARRLNSGLVEHLKPFQKYDKSFKTLPDSKDQSRRGGATAARHISVASTCTVMMAAIGAGEAAIGTDKNEKLFDKETLCDVFQKAVIAAEWGSSGLRDGNAFTTAIVIRCAGFVVQAGIMSAKHVMRLKHKRFPKNEGVAGKTLKAVVQQKANNGDKSFRVEKYPPKSTHAYWFVDGTIGLGVALRQPTWQRIARWASDEFHRQLIAVSAGNDALMDPPSLAMAACLINRVRRFSETNSKLASVSRMLPSAMDLRFGIDQVFSKQSDSGIWHRYFPLFHFPEGQGAADYCFSFEFLEAILVEFGESVLRDISVLERITRILHWCDKHELLFTDATGTYRGWNSGGELRKLAAGKSESWATATVHMFLTQLERRIDDVLDDLVLKRFRIDRTSVVESKKTFAEMVDTKVTFPQEKPTSLKKVVREEILKPAASFRTDQLNSESLQVPRSVLLFGPPGTSKTRLAKAIAEYLGWPLVVITPSQFLGKGLEQVHAQVDDRFHDLMDLRKTVVFFDEMDALAQTRESDPQDKSERGPIMEKQTTGSLDVTRQLLTTSMLPKLANLWSKKRVIFLMATNHKQQLDPAITRPNRFDLLLCVGPPTWASKRSTKSLQGILAIPKAKDVERELCRLAPNNSHAARRLNVFTVAEIGIFLDHLRRHKKRTTLLAALKRFKDTAEFQSMVDDWAAANITLRSDGRTVAEFLGDLSESRRQYYPGEK